MDKLRKDLPFNENTLLQTPNPIFSSSRTFSNSLSFNNDLPERLSDTLESNTSCDPSLEDSKLKRKKEIVEALKSLEGFSMKHKDLTSIPSCYFKSSKGVDSSLGEKLESSDSTISESDLLIGNTSTPRESLNNFELVRQGRTSLGRALAEAAASKSDLKSLLSFCQDSLAVDGSFKSGDEVLAKLDRDELSWRNKRDIPETVDCTFEQTRDPKMSLGSFFSKRSDDYLLNLAKSPCKPSNPIALVETTLDEDNSYRLSDIKNILASDHSVGTAVDELLQKKKVSKNKSPMRKSLPLDFNSTKNHQATKENISPEVLRDKRMSHSSRRSFSPKCIKEQASNHNLQKDLSPGFKDQRLSSSSRKSLSPKENVSRSKKSLSPKPAETRQPKRNSNSGEEKQSRQSFYLHGPTDSSKDKLYSETSSKLSSPDQLSERSVRSSSSLSNLPNGRLPIGSNKTELIWGCVKPGKTSMQKFILKNKSHSRVGFALSVSNPAFKIRKEGSETYGTDGVKIILQPYETRCVIIAFSPTTIGAYVDNLSFTTADANHKQVANQFVKLYGYGGFTNVHLHRIIKDTTLKFLLNLGNIDHESELRKSFTIKNTGSLPAFAYCNFAFHSFVTPLKLDISPKLIVLLPEEEKEIVVSMMVHKAEYNIIKSKTNNCVINIGKLEVIHGSEVDRARLKQIYRKAQEKKVCILNEYSALTEKFPGEVIPNDIKHFRESVSGHNEIIKAFQSEEITVTIEQDVDQTISEQLQDETAMFHSLLENTAQENACGEECIVEPTRVILTPPDKIKDRILLTNNSKKTQYFEIKSSPEGLYLKPQNGLIQSGETLFVDLVYYTDKCKDKTAFNVKILLDNECFDVDVKVICIRN